MHALLNRGRVIYGLADYRRQYFAFLRLSESIFFTRLLKNVLIKYALHWL